MKIGIYGGAFNPIHNGHISLAKQLKKAYSLDRIIFIPVCSSPHKEAVFLASEEDRLNICKLAVSEYFGFSVSDIEIRRKGKSYTIDTLKELRKEFPNDEFFLILGSDMLFYFTKWKGYREILKDIVILAGARKNGEYNALKDEANRLCKEGGRVFVSKISVTQISSTAIRMRIAQGSSCEDFLPTSVEAYIKEKGLYKAKGYILDEGRYIAKSTLTESRFYHTECVVEEAVRLAKRFNLSEERVALSAWLHDILKNRSNQELLQIMECNGIMLSDIELKSPALWHSIAAKDYCEKELGILDKEVLTAIRYHTTGRAGMSRLEQVLFLADAISKDRSYPGVALLRKTAYENIEKAILLSVTSLLINLLERGALLHPDTLELYRDLTVKAMEDKL